MHFAGNLFGFPTVKEFWQSVKNWQSYCHEFGVLFFGTQCICWRKYNAVSIQYRNV